MPTQELPVYGFHINVKSKITIIYGDVSKIAARCGKVGICKETVSDWLAKKGWILLCVIERDTSQPEQVLFAIVFIEPQLKRRFYFGK
jgi:hypothetical protein